jgi:hypothetical protein
MNDMDYAEMMNEDMEVYGAEEVSGYIFNIRNIIPLGIYKF